MAFSMGLKNMNILVSSGLGRLHLDKVASILKLHTSEEITFITGAIPNKKLAIIFFKIFGKFIYERNNIAGRLHLRIPFGMERKNVRSLYLPDFLLFFGLLLSKTKIISVDTVYSSSYFLFGFFIRLLIFSIIFHSYFIISF